MIKILIRGSGDVGSAAAHCLFQAGYGVVIHEVVQPANARRKMSFTDAVFDGRAMLHGVTAELVNDNSRFVQILAEHKYIPVSVIDFPLLIADLHPDILIDARMRKHQQPETQRGLARLTIGLGPNFIAGETVDAGIETGWEESMGRIIWHGATSPLSGEPREIEGHARDRYVYAPGQGIFHTKHQIGDKVQSGEEIASIDSHPLFAPISGWLRGITHDGVPVSQKAKIIEVDPRETGAQISGIGERAARIAEGVLEAVQIWIRTYEKS